MDKKLKIYILLFILLFMGFIYVEMNKPEPINWFPSYVSHHKIPYGTYVVHNELQDLLGRNTEISKINQSPFLFLQDSTLTGTYLFINDGVNFGVPEFERLKEFVNRGNDVFLSTHGATIDSFNLKTKPIASVAFEQDVFFNLSNRNLSRETFRFERPFYNTIFTEIDTVKAVVLGHTGYTNAAGETVEKGINFIKYKHGQGHFFFHTFPEAFTNYFMLKDANEAYVSSVLSYLNTAKPILWDSYYKTGKSQVISEMHYLLNTKSFKWAYYLALVGILIFVIFEGKRKQRVIPIVAPPKNQSLAFTRTIANMYYENQANKELAEHKIAYFLAYIRENFHLNTFNFDERFFQELGNKSNQSEDKVKKLFDLIAKIQQENNITKDDLLDLNRRIDTFKK